MADHDGRASRAATAAASGPYSSAIPADIAELNPILSSSLSADVDDATSALARFDSYARDRLGDSNPALGPMSAILLRTESATSSQIENLTAGARQIALAELHQSTSSNATSIVANVATMEAALRLADQLNEDAILAMHRQLLAEQPGWTEHAGQYRDELVWVGQSGITPRGASHVGPQANRVPQAMADLVRFINREDLPVVMHTAIAHAQFETIHPFSDGNGRTGRALVQAMVRGKGLITSTTAPISAGLLTNTSSYTEAISAYQSGDARPIIERFAEASRFAAHSGAQLVDQLAGHLDDARHALAAQHLRRQAVGWQVLPHLVAQPVINARYLQDHLGMNAVTAQRALSQLSEANIVQERTGLKRNRVWQHVGILTTLDNYAASLTRK